MGDDKQADAVNQFARDHFGSKVDAGEEGPPNLRVLGGEDKGDGPSLPWVELPGRGGRTIADFAHELSSVLAEVEIFRREEILFTVDGVSGELRMMTPERFLTWIVDHAVIYEAKSYKVGDNWELKKLPKTMPTTTAKACLASDAFYLGVRPLTRVNLVRMPHKRRDGRIVLLGEGYDDESEVYTLKSTVDIVEDMPIERAKKLLDDYYSEFPWPDIDPETGRSRSKAVAIAAALALFGMGLQPVEAARMGFVFRSNSQGGGKSLLAQMAITPSFGLPEVTPRAREEELRKNLDTAALQGASYLFFDNLKGHFESSLLEGFMTSPVWGGRVMGTQKKFKAQKSTMLLVTGNNLTLSPDLQRRMLQCDLFVEEFDLQERKHGRDLNPVELNKPEVRAEFLSALWALVRHWDAQERPPAGEEDDPFLIASFAQWSRIFGGIVQAADYGNPLVRPAADQQADQNTTHQRKLIELLAKPLSESPRIDYEFQAILDIMHENELFSWKMKGRVREKDGDDHFEPDPTTRSVIGLMLKKELSGRKFTTAEGRRVKFFVEGEGKARRYCLDDLATV